MKNWKTTVAGIVAAGLMVAALVWPEKVDFETQEVIKSAVNEILGAAGALVTVIAGWLAKDPE
jgi:hypothetical protein